MSRLLLVAVAAVILDVFALIDLGFFDKARIRTMNKLAWALIIILVPIVGALLWFLVGRGRGFGRRRGRGPLAPDDDPAFLRRIREEQEAADRIRRLEEELADLDGEGRADGATGLTPEGDAPGDIDSGESASGDGQPGR